MSVIIFACSSDDDSSDQGGTGGQEAFTFSLDGQEITITSWEALRRENEIGITGTDGNGNILALEFNRLGNLKYAATYNTSDLSIPYLSSHYYFNSNYFSFNLTNLDEENNRVVGNFSGNVYEDDFDLTSLSSQIEGTFNVEYTNIPPQLEGYGLNVFLDGEEWLNSNEAHSHGGSGSNIELSFHNDGAYTISVIINHNNTTPGVYTYNSSSNGNQIIAVKYNPDTQEFSGLHVDGVIEITEKGDFDFFSTYVRGNFTGTITDPDTNETISMTNGTFATAYTNY